MNNTDLGQKRAYIFSCLICDFNTCKKTHYIRHLDTEKHKKRSIIQNNTDLGQKGQNDIFFCECGKAYKHKPNLYAHRKKCNYKESSLIVKNDDNVNYYKEIINELINQNKNLMEQNKKVIELTQKSGNIITNNIANTINNTTNQNLNINLFLNEKCKNAITIDDFVNSIEVSVNDLLFIKDKGIVKGLANIIANNLNDLPFDKRPIWCSDKKRKKIFIKEVEWSEDVDNQKTKQAIDGVTRIQTKNIVKYQQAYPNCMSNEKEKENFINMVSKNTEPTKGKEENIITNIIDTIYLDETSKNQLK